jgi:hypothetical protein
MPATRDPWAEAERLAGMGRYGDTMLAHITPHEAAILKSLGGAGTRNPRTGLLEFWSDSSGGFGGSEGGDNSDDTNSDDSFGGGGGDGGGNWSGGGLTMDAISGGFGTPGSYNPNDPSMGYGPGDVGRSDTSQMGQAEARAYVNNNFNRDHPAVQRAREIDAGTVQAKSFLDRIAEAFDPTRAFSTEPVDVINQVTGLVSGPVGMAMSLGRALSEYALDRGWSIDYSYANVMGTEGGDTTTENLRNQLKAYTGGLQAPAAETPKPTAPPVKTEERSPPGYRILLGGGNFGGWDVTAPVGIDRASRTGGRGFLA